MNSIIRWRAAVAAAGIVVLAVPVLLSAPGAAAGEDGLAKLGVVSSSGTGAVIGVISRIPAESPGGGAYTETLITPDKALGRAAGFTPGPLAETFFGTSSEHYRNPSMVVAQQPAGLFPAEDRAPIGASGPAGSFGLIHAAAPSRSEVAAEVVMAAGPPGAPITVEGGLSRSSSLVEPDGTVVTAVEVGFGRVVAGALELSGGHSRALARTPAGRPPVLDLETTLGRIAVNGVAAELTDSGLAVAGSEALSAAEVARFNAGLAQLAQAGISIEAVPRHHRAEDGSGHISGAAGLLRYRLPQLPVPNSIGNDEALLLASVSATAVAQPASGAAPESLPAAVASLPGVPAEAPSPVAVPPAVPRPAGAAGFAAVAGVDATSAVRGWPSGVPGSASVGDSGVAPTDAQPSPDAGTATGAGSDNAALFPASVLPTGANRPLVSSVIGFYVIVLMLGTVAVLVMLGLHKFRTV
jgi:hypothetical protein